MALKTVFLVNLPLNDEGLAAHHRLIARLQGKMDALELLNTNTHDAATRVPLGDDVAIFFMAESALFAFNEFGDLSECKEVASSYLELKAKWEAVGERKFERKCELLVCGMAAKALGIKERIHPSFTLSGYMDLIKLMQDALVSSELQVYEYTLSKNEFSKIHETSDEFLDDANAYDLLVVFNEDPKRSADFKGKDDLEHLNLGVDMTKVLNGLSLEQGLGIALNAADLELKVGALFLNDLSKVDKTLIKKLKQLELYEVESFVSSSLLSRKADTHNEESFSYARDLSFVNESSDRDVVSLFLRAKCIMVC